MGTGASTSAAHVGAYTTARRLLNLLQQRNGVVSQPIIGHEGRTPSGSRGVSLAFILAFLNHTSENGGDVNVEMGRLCTEGEASVCSLTASTGLSLVESCILLQDTWQDSGGEGGVHVGDGNAAGLFGAATALFSYSWTGTSLADVFGSLEELGTELPLETTYFWIDLFAASQNLLAGRYEGYKEDTDRIFADAVRTTGAVVLYCSPLLDEWDAPPHPFLSPERERRGAPPAPWRRKGPRSVTRAWCLFEVAESLRASHRLHVALSSRDRAGLEQLLTMRFSEIILIFSEIDANNAQVSKINDRGLIHGRISVLSKRYESINESVKDGLRNWLVDTSRVIEEAMQPTGGDVVAKTGRLLRLSKLKNGRGQLLIQLARHQDAEVAFKDALALLKEHSCNDEEINKMKAAVLNGIAMSLRSQGKFNEAEPFYNQALGIVKEVFGEDSEECSSLLNNLADLFLAQGMYDKAVPLYEQALASFKKANGEECPHVAKTLNNLANGLSHQGKLDEAGEMYKQSIAISKKVFHQDHPIVGTLCNNLAQLLFVQGKYGEAEPLYEQSMTSFRKIFGEEHPKFAALLDNFAQLKSAQGKYTEGEKLERQSLVIKENVYGKDHPDYALGLNNLLPFLRHQGKLDEAKLIGEQSLAINEKVYGNEHCNTATSISSLACVLKEQGKLDEAEPLFKRALVIMKKVHGEDHPMVATSLHHLAALLKARGKVEEAEPLYKQSLATHRKFLGEEHPDLSALIEDLAQLLNDKGKYEEAEKLLRQGLVISEKVYGKEHPDYLLKLNKLSGLLKKHGKSEESEKLWSSSGPPRRVFFLMVQGATP